jgi:UDPglucose--hexose-1-phosphate uridylyltransferase
VSELRRDPITGRTVIVAPERLPATRFSRPAGTIGGDFCPFCEGHEHVAGREILAWRTSGEANTPGWRVRVVPNRLPALRVESDYAEPAGGLFQILGGLGAHEVIIESPVHTSDWALMGADEIRLVLWAWRERIRDLRRDIRLKTFLVVKNVGAPAGATLDHPHSQLLALPFVPLHLEDALAAARLRHEQMGRCVFCAVVDDELDRDVRVVSSDEDTIAISAFAARVPFETWVVPRRHLASFDDECDDCLQAIAGRIRDTVRRLHVALNGPAYSVLLHTAPVGESGPLYHWHIEIVPRLTPVGALAWDRGIHINPVSPEEAAKALRGALGP